MQHRSRQPVLRLAQVAAADHGTAGTGIVVGVYLSCEIQGWNAWIKQHTDKCLGLQSCSYL